MQLSNQRLNLLCSANEVLKRAHSFPTEHCSNKKWRPYGIKNNFFKSVGFEEPITPRISGFVGLNMKSSWTVVRWQHSIPFVSSSPRSAILITQDFPASRAPFSFVFAELTDGTKRDLCHGSKWTVLSMRHGYLATETSHDAFSTWSADDSHRSQLARQKTPAQFCCREWQVHQNPKKSRQFV